MVDALIWERARTLHTYRYRTVGEDAQSHGDGGCIDLGAHVRVVLSWRVA